jgi:SAM-dependent methyltransferase
VDLRLAEDDDGESYVLTKSDGMIREVRSVQQARVILAWSRGPAGAVRSPAATPSIVKLRESGMPPQDFWETLLDVPAILDAFGFGAATGDMVELGCGYGTFTVPLAARIGGVIHAVDIEPEMVAQTAERARAAGLANIRVQIRDVSRNGFGVPPGSCDAALLFNILHGEEPVALLSAARDAVRPGGHVAVIHWRSDVSTPRGPSAGIRPAPERILEWSVAAGGLEAEGPPFLLPPWHYGLKLGKRQPPGPDTSHSRQ